MTAAGIEAELCDHMRAEGVALHKAAEAAWHYVSYTHVYEVLIFSYVSG